MAVYKVEKNEYGRFEVINHHGMGSEWRATFARKDHAELYATMLQQTFDIEAQKEIDSLPPSIWVGAKDWDCF
jgi:hypothetical protein